MNTFTFDEYKKINKKLIKAMEAVCKEHGINHNDFTNALDRKDVLNEISDCLASCIEFADED